MRSETWNRLHDLFDRATQLQGEGRQAFLDEACAGNPELRHAVEGLLAADAAAGAFLDVPLLPLPPPDPEQAPHSQVPGSQPTPPHPNSADSPGVSEKERSQDTLGPARVGDFGPYRILRRLGQGGMGVVYLAVRDDDTFQRRVVIKQVRGDLLSADTLRRLRTERQILASLDHPNIARLFDGGTTADQRPYFVMEYVEGVPIDRYCDDLRLSIDQRLELFRKVCSAVHYAHQNLVVHRDLKPSNILVTAAGEPKLLDFGIAKLQNPELAAAELAPTVTWQHMLTPQYASPEQIRGKLVTTASDVYSLGVLLFKLLTGRRPFDFRQCSPQDIERLLSEQEPPRPSTVVTDGEGPATKPRGADQGTPQRAEDIARCRQLTPRELRRRLTGDLDAIVLKTLRSAPRSRYASVEHLASDIERAQDGLPVEARQGTLTYRAARLLRRHRLAFSIAGALLLLLITFAVHNAGQVRRLAQERDRAQLERQHKETVLTLLLDILKVADPNVGDGESWTVRQALDASRGPLDRRLRDTPELRAELLHTTGVVYSNLGLWQRARSDLEEALSLRRALGGQASREVARSQRALGRVLAELGEIDGALQLTADALEQARLRGDPAELLATLNDQVTVLCFAGHYTAAVPLADEALALARGGSQGPPDALVTALFNQGTLLLDDGDNPRAAELFRQSAELLATLNGEEHLSLAEPVNNLGTALRRSGDLAEAEAAFLRVLDIQRAALGEDHPYIPRTLNNLASLAMDQGLPDRAGELWHQALGLLQRQVGNDHPRILFLQLQIEKARLHQGQATQVLAGLEALLAPWRQRLPAEHRTLMMAERVRAEALTHLRRYDEAEAVLKASAEILRRQSSERDLQLVQEQLLELQQLRDASPSLPVAEVPMVDS